MKRNRGAKRRHKHSVRLIELWDLRSKATLDWCAVAALYSEAIEHREGPDGGVRFLMNQFHIEEPDARDVIRIGRSIVGHVKVPRIEWDKARESTAMPIIERMEARLAAD